MMACSGPSFWRLIYSFSYTLCPERQTELDGLKESFKASKRVYNFTLFLICEKGLHIGECHGILYFRPRNTAWNKRLDQQAKMNLKNKFKKSLQ